MTARDRTQPDRPPAPRPDDEYRPDPDRWKALAVVLAAGFMTLLDVSIVNVALPSIEQGLHAQPNELQWIVAGYALALGLLLVPAGRFGDAHGRRPVFMLGVALFVVASAACGLAPTALALVLMRIVQGFAGGLISPQISGLIQSLFRGEERGKAFGYFGSTIGVSTAVGPLIGGALIALFGDPRRLAGGVLRQPADRRGDPAARPPLPAGADRGRAPAPGARPARRRAAGRGGRVHPRPVHRAAHVARPAAPRAVPAGRRAAGRVGAARAPLRAAPASRSSSLDLFRIRSYVLGAPVGLLYFAGFIAVFFILTQYLQLGLDYPAWKSGLAATPFAIGGVLVASAGSRQALRRGPKLVAFGLATVLVGLAGVWLAVGRPSRPRRRAVDGAAAADRRPRRRARDLAQPDPHAVPGAGRARRQRRRRAADRSADRLGRRHRGGGQPVLLPAGHTRGDFGTAVQDGLLLIVAFVVVALAIAIADLVVERRG